MNKIFAAGTAALVLAASPASASVVISNSVVGSAASYAAPAGSTTVINFNSGDVAAEAKSKGLIAATAGLARTFSGTVYDVDGTDNDFFRPEPSDSTSYFGVGRNSSLTLTSAVALKMSFHYWLNRGKPDKKRFVTLTNSYHGETMAAMSVGDVPLFTETYKALLLDTLKVPSPDCYNRPQGMSWEEHSRNMFAAMEQTLTEHHDSVAAVIVEPLIQGAGGMRMYHPVYLKLLREACDRYGVHLIHDEIAVGFGRTGSMFACEQAGIRPDFLCLSKALTGGYLPLAACLTTDEVYDAFYDDYPTLRAFLHSHSYTGNPLACAAALATLDIFEQDNVIENNKALAQRMGTATAHLVDHPHVAEVRQTGMALAIEMVQDKATKTAYPWQERRGLQVFQHALERGALLRPLGSVVYFLPPYVITPEQIDFLAEVASEGIDIATRSNISVAVRENFHPDFRDPG